MTLHAIHDNCGGTVTIELRIYAVCTLYSITCDRYGTAKEGRSRRKKKDWETDHEEMRLGRLSGTCL